jgi:hypothetical protein
VMARVTRYRIGELSVRWRRLDASINSARTDAGE